MGVCNPASAHSKTRAEEDVGLMLPYGVTIYEKDGKIMLAEIKPTAVNVEAKIKQVIDSVCWKGSKNGKDDIYDSYNCINTVTGFFTL